MSKKRSRTERRFRAVRRLEEVEITVQEPCLVSWDTMKGERFVRFCSVCQLQVYNFAGLSPDQTVALLNQHEGKLCAQFYARSDGTMTVEPCVQSGKEPELERGGLIVTPHQLAPLPPNDSSSDEPQERHNS